MLQSGSICERVRSLFIDEPEAIDSGTAFCQRLGIYEPCMQIRTETKYVRNININNDLSQLIRSYVLKS